MLFKSSGPISWLAVFLGNPGPRYALTRHNAGLMAADALAKDKGIRIDRLRFHALTGELTLGDARVLVMKPQTYMNLSGEAVAAAARFYKIPPEHVLVVSDEVSLPVGRLRVRAKGSAGGHNGLRSIIEALGSDAFPRIRIGVGAPPHPDYDMADWVLGVFHDRDAEQLQDAAARAAQAVEAYVTQGPERAMNRFNQKNEPDRGGCP
ncbi:MAG: aminoacyl-tRNA hydrolase [Oscillospiraceae bacterium]|nr:aminoacyl-tRNA hydrolase [Oscillospiraceae bacterium]